MNQAACVFDNHLVISRKSYDGHSTFKYYDFVYIHAMTRRNFALHGKLVMFRYVYVSIYTVYIMLMIDAYMYVMYYIFIHICIQSSCTFLPTIRK